MRWRCRLEGGPFDGDQGSIHDVETLPDKMWAYRCPDCRDIHWSFEWVRAGEVYEYDRMEEKDEGHVAVYVHSDIDLSGLPVIHECELTPTTA